MSPKSGDRPPRAQSDWAYFLDVDGTLIEIAARPDAVRVPPDLITLLDDACGACDGACALISGRTIAELDRLFAPLRLAATGLHGVEWRISGESERTQMVPDSVIADHDGLHAALSAARSALGALAIRHPALSVEDKGAALAVHYRAAPALADAVSAAAARIVDAWPGLIAQPGKMVVELKPAGVDKGQAVRRYLASPPFRGRRPVYIGDDLTDEFGFAAVNAAGGVSIRVGRRQPTQARWRLSSVEAVHRWLRTLLLNREAGVSHDIA